MTYPRIILLFIILKTQFVFGQNRCQDSLINKFRNDIHIDLRENSGVISMCAETKESYYSLLAYSTTENLIKYTNDTNAYIRANVFFGLMSRNIKKSQIRNILALHEQDTSTFISRRGCVLMKWTVRDFMKYASKSKVARKWSIKKYKKEIEEIQKGELYEFKLDGISHGLMDKDRVLKMDRLLLTNKDMKVKSFDFFLNDQEFSSANDYFTDEMKIAIEKAKSGDAIFLYEIKVIVEDNIVRNIGSKSIKLK